MLLAPFILPQALSEGNSRDTRRFHAIEISGDFSSHGKSSVKEEILILKVVTSELAELDKGECLGQLHYFSFHVKDEKPKLLYLFFRTKYYLYN